VPDINDWPIVRQLRNLDVAGLGETAVSDRTARLEPRIKHVDRVAASVCPYCAVGCGQLRRAPPRSNSSPANIGNITFSIAARTAQPGSAFRLSGLGSDLQRRK
jgi:anaerobic selenocysteine-containing dehydrogenase